MPVITALKAPLCPIAAQTVGKVQWHENPAVRPATEKEIADLLRARAEDDECDPVE